MLNYILVVRKARQADLPPWLTSKMLFNNAVSAIGGIIPVAGDVVIALYKANSRNAMLLEEFLRIRGEEYLKLQSEEDEVRSGRTVTVASGVSQRDMEQVKPGAGMETGRSFTSFMSQRGKKQTTESDSNRGRFVENMNN